MKAADQFQRFSSVPLVDLDLLLSDGGGDQNLRVSAQDQAYDGIETRKAPVVTTGIPGLAGVEVPIDKMHESPRSPLNTLSSMDSPMSSQKTPADRRKMKMAGPEQVTISRDISGSVNSGSADDSELRRSLRNHGTDDKKHKEKRKVGRPIAYCGDPNSPDLTPPERRRILRRIANRESARRVRARRLDLLDDMAKKAQEMEAEKTRLQQRLGAVESRHSAMVHEVQALDCNLRAKSAENEVLHAHIQELRKSFSMGEGQVAKAALMSSPGTPADESSFSAETAPAGAELASVAGLSGGAYSGPSVFSAQDQFALLPSIAPASGGFNGNNHFTFPPAPRALSMPQMEPIDRSFSEFLKDEFAANGTGIC